MRSWLRPSLRYGSVSTMPLARSAAAIAVGVDARRSRWWRSRGCAPPASATNGVANAARLGPPVDDLGRPVAARSRPTRGRRASSIHSSWCRRAGTASRARACCTSGRAGEFSSAIVQVERRRDPAAGRARCARCARSRAGEQQREPEPAVAGERLLRREVVDVELRRDRRAARPRPTWRRRGRARRAAAVGPAHRRSSRRSTSRCAGARTRRRRRRRRARGACPAPTRSRPGRRGAARPRRRPRTSTRTRRTPGARLRRSTSPNAARVPERGRAAVAEQHLVAVGEREELARARRGRGRTTRAHAVAGGGSCRGTPGAASASAAHRLGADLRRAGAEAAVGRAAARREADRRRASVTAPRLPGAPSGRRGRSTGCVARRLLARTSAGARVAPTARVTVPRNIAVERGRVAEREQDVTADREPHAEREPVVHERRAGAPVERERVEPLHDRRRSPSMTHDRGAEERRVQLLARVELARAARSVARACAAGTSAVVAASSG